LVNVEGLLSQAVAHEGRMESVPNKDFVPPVL
jgi:hypothetical protein